MKSALIIEDEDDVALILELIAEENGFEVTRVANGLDGIKAVESHEWDVILLDLVMKEMDGFSVLRQIERGRPTAMGRVIVVSKLRAEELPGMFAICGVVRKSMKVAETRDRLKELFNRLDG